MGGRHRQMARTAAALFGTASVVTLLSVVPPHQPQLDREGLVLVAAGAAVLAAVLLYAAKRHVEPQAPTARQHADYPAWPCAVSGARRGRAAPSPAPPPLTPGGGASSYSVGRRRGRSDNGSTRPLQG
jgi:hypothetical protein